MLPRAASAGALPAFRGFLFCGFPLRCGAFDPRAGAGGEFGVDEIARVAEKGFELDGGESVPALEGDPVRAGEIGRGEDAFALDEFGEALGAGGEGEHGTRRAEHEDREHFATDGFAGYPENEVVAPLQGFGDVGQSEEKGAGGFGIHG